MPHTEPKAAPTLEQLESDALSLFHVIEKLGDEIKELTTFRAAKMKELRSIDYKIITLRRKKP